MSGLTVLLNEMNQPFILYIMADKLSGFQRDAVQTVWDIVLRAMGVRFRDRVMG